MLSSKQLLSHIHLESFSFEVVTKQGMVKYSRQATAQRFAEDLGNGVRIEMLAIPGGEFWMGAASSEKDSEEYDNDRPQHLVQVPAFYMGRYPITQTQYAVVIGSNPARFKGTNFPVENLCWHDAQLFCQKLMERTKKNYRLPSEAEWEYACRARTTTPFCFGETIDLSVANYDARDYADGYSCKAKSRASLTAVGSFPANSFGLGDVHGNVYEWCADSWHDNYDGAPIDGTVWQNDAAYSHVLRGGSWSSVAMSCRSAYRSECDSDNKEHSSGLRIALSTYY